MQVTGQLGDLFSIALEQIRTDIQIESSFCTWVLDWVTDELQQSAKDIKGRLDISSLYTYLGVIARKPRQLDELGVEDPYEWTDVEWRVWLEALNSDISGQHVTIPTKDEVKSGSLKTPSIHKRVKDAAARLVRNLVQRGHWVPAFVRSVLTEGDEFLPSGSSSACLITDNDITRAIDLARNWLSEKPLDALMLGTRARIQHSIPSRSSEISNLRSDCLTQGGTLIIERVGYKNIKNDQSVRTLKVPPTLRQLINDHNNQLALYKPDPEFLFRGYGAPEDGVRDVTLINLLSTSLKHITGDPSARPHSLRAIALQNTAWPDWLVHASKLLGGQASPLSLSVWIQEHQEWTRLAFGVCMAGHNDLRASFGNYLAGWNLVCSLHAASLLCKLDPRPKYLIQLGVDPAALRKYKQRTPEGRCEWQWLFSRIAKDSVQKLRILIRQSGGQTPAFVKLFDESTDPDSVTKKSANTPRQPHHQTFTATTSPFKHLGSDGVDLADITYLSARILGMTTPQAIEMNDMNFSHATRLETLIPPGHLTLMVSGRARSAAQQRGRQGNLAVLHSDQGQKILEWVRLLNEKQISTAAEIVFRYRSKALPDRHMADFWNDLLTGIPDFCALQIRRNPKYLGGIEHSQLIRNNGSVDLKLDSQIGSIPGVRVITRDTDNRVLGTRLNSVFRSALLSFVSIRGRLNLDD